MNTVTAEEAKAGFFELLDQVENGETVMITRGGRTIAKLFAPESPSKSASFDPDEAERRACA